MFHLGYHVTYGWVGVQLFFVLSGYLITGILRRTKHNPGYWQAFYKKRAARILPPILLLMAFYVVFTTNRQIPTILGYTFFAGNLMTFFPHYGSSVLQPLWSLAVEEHFYLLWPLAVRRLNVRRLTGLLITILIAEPILRALATHHFATYEVIYSFTPFQLDSLAAGSLLALLTEGGVVLPKAGRLVLVLLPGLALCTVPHRNINSVLWNALAYSYLALLFVAFVTWVLSLESGFFFNLLSSRPMAYLGRISYGVYLYHIPVSAAMQRLGIGFFPLNVLSTICLALLSYRLVETPIIEYARREFRRPVLETAEE